MSAQRTQIPVNSCAQTLWAHITVTVTLDIDLLQMVLLVMILTSALRIPMAVLRTARTQREATLVSVILVIDLPVTEWGAGVSQTIPTLNGSTVN